jgi:hypothetical protein
MTTRAENDFYPTPPYATEALLARETFTPFVLEPACGKGDISKVLEANKYIVLSYDLIKYGYGGIGDFLESDDPAGLDIITNPPYCLALEFLMHAKTLSHNKIAFLLRTAFLESQKRYQMFQDTQFPLKCIYQFSSRLTIHKDGTDKSGGKTAYAWFVWDRSYVGEPSIRWIQ